jgi:hypothetical protein
MGQKGYRLWARKAIGYGAWVSSIQRAAPHRAEQHGVVFKVVAQPPEHHADHRRGDDDARRQVRDQPPLCIVTG